MKCDQCRHVEALHDDDSGCTARDVVGARCPCAGYFSSGPETIKQVAKRVLTVGAQHETNIYRGKGVGAVAGLAHIRDAKTPAEHVLRGEQ